MANIENQVKKAKEIQITRSLDSEVDKRPTSYTLMQKEREAREAKKAEDDAQAVFLDYLEYYNKNYPKSIIGYEYLEPKVKFELGKESFEKALDVLSEQQLLDARNILKYSREEHKGKGMPEYYTYLHCMALINRRIPGATYQEELSKLKDQEQETKKRKKELETLIETERVKFNAKRLQPIVAEKKEEPKTEVVQIETSEFICPNCGKDCHNKGGLAVHVRTHNK